MTQYCSVSIPIAPPADLCKYVAQITHILNGPCVSHDCDTCGVNHTRMGFLDSTHMYTHMQYLHMHMRLHVRMLVWLM